MKLLVNNNNSWLCDFDVTCHMATKLTSSHNTSWFVTLTSHHNSYHWFDELISFINWLKILLSFATHSDSIFHMMITWHVIWQQGVTNFHSNPWFCVASYVFVCFEFRHQYLSWHAIIFDVPWSFWSHEFHVHVY